VTVSRRDLAGLALAGGAALSAATAATAEARRDPARGPRPADDTAYWTGVKGGEHIAMLLYPGMTAFDLIGPHYFFATMKGAKIHLVAASMAPVACDRNITLVPDATFADMPRDIDMLFVPGGGAGTLKAMEDEATLAFLADRGARARYVTSICTGSLILGAAGLLKGYRATSHWKCHEALTAFGAIRVQERVVEDRNRVTGAGVTAGIDFAMYMATKLRGPDNARAVQLIAEYDPQPMFRSGAPDRAWPQTTKLVTDLLPSFNQTAIAIGRRRMGAGA
jgi:putative intracellular protease/amidase